ncbi:MAG: hypothetical protein ACO1PB_12870, partial [Ramlibacter sp.]
AAAPAAPRPRTEAAAPALGPSARAAAPRPTRGGSRRQAGAPAPAAPASRLRLAPLELGPERDAILHFSTELTLPGAGDAGQRAAAAALWQALNKTPEEAVQEGLKLQALDREIQSLRQLTQQNAAAVTTMRQQVQAARADRNQVSTLALLLLALVLALAAWVGWRWYQSRRLAGVTRWFEANRQDPGDSQASLPASQAPARQPVMPSNRAKAARAGLPPVDRHLETAPLDVAAARAAIASWSPSDPPASDFQPSQGGTTRTVGVRELLDVHDKADFFLSIGQHEQAIAVLEAHVHDQVETSALPWLDLLELYHSLGRRKEFEARRTEFRQRFTAQVPDFDHFDEPTSSLENYSRALSRIVALWPSRRVLEIIEESMFRKPGLQGADTFSLEAYRELVLLYHIAQEVAPPEHSEHVNLDEPHSEFTSTSMQPLSELDAPEIDLDVPLDLDDLAPAPHSQAAGAVPDGTLAWGDPHAADRDPLFIPPASPRLGLDIDLSDMSDAVEAQDPPAAADAADPTLVLPQGARELPPLDFDTSAFEPGAADEPPRRG